jgi:exonuclease VII small subunit
MNVNSFLRNEIEIVLQEFASELQQAYHEYNEGIDDLANACDTLIIVESLESSDAEYDDVIDDYKEQIIKLIEELG